MSGISTLIKHWSDYGSQSIGRLTGETIAAIWISESDVTFQTVTGAEWTWEAAGDCCSASYIYSLEGVERLLAGRPIVAVHSIELQEGDLGWHDPNCQDCSWRPGGYAHDVVEVYGYRFTTVDPRWGEVSSVLSFRNDSNGYYGGWLDFRDQPHGRHQRRIAGDWIEGGDHR